MAVTQVASYERESGAIAGGAAGNLTLAAPFTPAAGETLVVWFVSGSTRCQPSGAPAVSGGVTWTQRQALALTSTAPIYCWTGVVPATPAAVNPSVPYSSQAGSATTAAHLIVQRFSGVTLPATPNAPASTTAVTTAGAGGATLAVTQQAANSAWTWVGADWNGVISGAPTPANADTLAQSYLMPTAGTLADWGYWRVSAATGATTVGFSGFSTAATRKLTFVALELPPTPVTTGFTSARTANFDSGTIPATFPVAYGGSTVAGGRLRIPATNTDGIATNYAGIKSADQVNGADRFDDFFFQVTQVTGSGGANAAPSMAWVYANSQPASTRIGWEYDPNTGTLSAKSQVGYADAGAVALTYAAATHAWWRVRNTSGNIIWETSATGVAGSWTQRRTMATPAWANGTDISITIESYRTTGVSDFFEVDNVNIAAATPPPSGLYWRPDMTQADVVAAGYWNSGSQRENGAGQFNDPTVPWPAVIQAAPGGRPGRAIPFTIPNNYIRYEVEPPDTLNAFNEGDDYYFGFAFYLAAGFPLTPTDFQVIEQLHAAPGQGSPPVAFEVRSGLRLTGGFGKPKLDGTNYGATYAYEQVLLSSLATQQWYNVVYHVHFSGSSANAVVDVWVDGTQVLAGFHPPGGTIYGTDTSTEGGPSYLKMGIYHDASIAGGTIWHAGDAIGHSYADVDPTPATTQISAKAVSGTRATLTGRQIAPIPSSPPSGADALQARTLTEIRLWEQWLSTNSAGGLVGEFGVPSVWARFGDQPQQDQWTALLAVYLSELDRAGLHSTAWASGRNWNVDYTIGLHTPTTKGGPIDTRLATVPTVGAHPSRNGQLHGLNLSGWEEGVATGNTGAGNVRPGTSYAPQAPDFAFVAADGIDFVRLPMAWERIQPTLGAALDTAALTQLDGLLTAARNNGISIMLDLHNYGRYTLANGTLVALGSAQLTSAHLADFWSRMITWVAADTNRSNTVVAVGLMNEPHDLPGGVATWQNASQAAVTAIRNAVN